MLQRLDACVVEDGDTDRFHCLTRCKGQDPRHSCVVQPIRRHVGIVVTHRHWQGIRNIQPDSKNGCAAFFINDDIIDRNGRHDVPLSLSVRLWCVQPGQLNRHRSISPRTA